MKKNKHLFFSILSLFLGILFFVPKTLLALEPQYQFPEPSKIQIEVSLSTEEASLLLQALQQGYLAEISFTVRVFQPRKGHLFGDALISEEQHAYTARWDPIAKDYTMYCCKGEKIFHLPSWESFLRYFTVSPALPIPQSKGNYSLCQVVLRPQVLLPPLQIFNPLGKTVKSSWLRLDKLP
ncbi:MAG: hypothetical protein SNJ78_09025 [Spirochaetales bacterium]